MLISDIRFSRKDGRIALLRSPREEDIMARERERQDAASPAPRESAAD